VAEAIDRIDPVPSWPTARNPFGSAAEAFDAGNYPLAFDMAAEGSEIRACAKVMCGAIADGLSDLRKFESPRARLIRAYALWCLNQTEEAQSLLREIGRTEFGPIVQALLDLLAGPIDIVMLSTPGDEKHKSYSEIPGIHAHWIQLDVEQFGITMADALAAVLPPDARPRLILSPDAYGPYVPREQRAPGIPIAYWASDHDFFFATRHGSFEQADIIVVNSAAEQVEVSRHYDARCAAIPSHDSYRQGKAVTADDERDIDIFFTGRAFTSYMRDKAQFLFRLATLDSPDVKIDFTEGYLPVADYWAMLQRAKFVPIYWRSAGGLQTRAVETMRAGASVLSPERAIARPLLGDAAALYRSAVDADVIAMLEDRRPSGRAVARDIDNLFWASPAREERFIKFCLFQSLLAPRRKTEIAEPTFYPVELRGYDTARGIKVYTRLARLNGAVEVPHATHFLHAAAAAFYAAILINDNSSAGQAIGQMALDFYRTGIEAHPTSLALRFNGARALWTFNRRDEALIQFHAIVEQLPDLVFDPRTDQLLSHRIHVFSDMFPYGDFLRAMVEQPGSMQGSARSQQGARDFIVSASLGYIAADLIERGEWTVAIGILQRALERCAVNVAAWRLMTQSLANAKAAPATIREAFYRTVNLYPAELLNLLPFGLEAELADSRRSEAAQVLRKWVLVRARTHDINGNPPPVSDAALAAAQRHRGLLTDWTAALFDRIVGGN